MEAKLIVISGKANMGEVKLRLPMKIGRGKTAHLIISHPSVSREHCHLLEVDGLLVVRDNQSSNGVYVDGKQVTEAVVRPGQTLSIGPLTFRADYVPEGDVRKVEEEDRRRRLADTATLESKELDSLRDELKFDRPALSSKKGGTEVAKPETAPASKSKAPAAKQKSADSASSKQGSVAPPSVSVPEKPLATPNVRDTAEVDLDEFLFEELGDGSTKTTPAPHARPEAEPPPPQADGKRAEVEPDFDFLADLDAPSSAPVAPEPTADAREPAADAASPAAAAGSELPPVAEPPPSTTSEPAAEDFDFANLFSETSAPSVPAAEQADPFGFLKAATPVSPETSPSPQLEPLPPLEEASESEPAPVEVSASQESNSAHDGEPQLSTSAFDEERSEADELRTPDDEPLGLDEWTFDEAAKAESSGEEISRGEEIVAQTPTMEAALPSDDWIAPIEPVAVEAEDLADQDLVFGGDVVAEADAEPPSEKFVFPMPESDVPSPIESLQDVSIEEPSTAPSSPVESIVAAVVDAAAGVQGPDDAALFDFLSGASKSELDVPTAPTEATLDWSAFSAAVDVPAMEQQPGTTETPASDEVAAVEPPVTTSPAAEVPSFDFLRDEPAPEATKEATSVPSATASEGELSSEQDIAAAASSDDAALFDFLSGGSKPEFDVPAVATEATLDWSAFSAAEVPAAEQQPATSEAPASDEVAPVAPPVETSSKTPPEVDPAATEKSPFDFSRNLFEGFEPETAAKSPSDAPSSSESEPDFAAFVAASSPADFAESLESEPSATTAAATEPREPIAEAIEPVPTSSSNAPLETPPVVATSKSASAAKPAAKQPSLFDKLRMLFTGAKAPKKSTTKPAGGKSVGKSAAAKKPAPAKCEEEELLGRGPKLPKPSAAPRFDETPIPLFDADPASDAAASPQDAAVAEGWKPVDAPIPLFDDEPASQSAAESSTAEPAAAEASPFTDFGATASAGQSTDVSIPLVDDASAAATSAKDVPSSGADDLGAGDLRVVHDVVVGDEPPEVSGFSVDADSPPPGSPEVTSAGTTSSAAGLTDFELASEIGLSDETDVPFTAEVSFAVEALSVADEVDAGASATEEAASSASSVVPEEPAVTEPPATSALNVDSAVTFEVSPAGDEEGDADVLGPTLETVGASASAAPSETLASETAPEQKVRIPEPAYPRRPRSVDVDLRYSPSMRLLGSVRLKTPRIEVPSMEPEAPAGRSAPTRSSQPAARLTEGLFGRPANVEAESPPADVAELPPSATSEPATSEVTTPETENAIADSPAAEFPVAETAESPSFSWREPAESVEYAVPFDCGKLDERAPDVAAATIDLAKFDLMESNEQVSESAATSSNEPAREPTPSVETPPAFTIAENSAVAAAPVEEEIPNFETPAAVEELAEESFSFEAVRLETGEETEPVAEFSLDELKLDDEPAGATSSAESPIPELSMPETFATAVEIEPSAGTAFPSVSESMPVLDPPAAVAVERPAESGETGPAPTETGATAEKRAEPAIDQELEDFLNNLGMK